MHELLHFYTPSQLNVHFFSLFLLPTWFIRTARVPDYALTIPILINFFFDFVGAWNWCSFDFHFIWIDDEVERVW